MSTWKKVRPHIINGGRARRISWIDGFDDEDKAKYVAIGVWDNRKGGIRRFFRVYKPGAAEPTETLWDALWNSYRPSIADRQAQDWYRFD